MWEPRCQSASKKPETMEGRCGPRVFVALWSSRRRTATCLSWGHHYRQLAYQLCRDFSCWFGLLSTVAWTNFLTRSSVFRCFFPKIDFIIFLIFPLYIFLVEWNPLGLDSRTALDGLDGLRPGLSSNLRVMRCKTFGTLIETLWNYMEFIGILEVWIAFLFLHLFDVFVWPSIHKTSPTSKMWGSAFNWLVVKEWSFTMWMVVANCGPVQSKHPRSLRMQCATGHTPSVQTQFFAPFAFPITEI